MELTFDQIKSAATGAVSITREDGLIRFHRMHPAQLDAALARGENYFIRANCTRPSGQTTPTPGFLP